jgi:hypothetical protein
MPIDFSRIASDWAARFRARQRMASRALALLGPWLAERLERMEVLERRTRGWPVYVFEGRALSVQLARSQIGIVEPYGSTGAAAAAPFVTFGRSFTRIPQAASDEWVLPGMLAAIRRVVTVVSESIDRWRTPQAAMFDPNRARASDLFGMAGMAWRGLVTSLPQLRRTAEDMRDALRPLVPGRPAGGAVPEPPADAEAPTGSTGSSLERYIVAAILILPILPSWIENLATAAWIAARVKVIDLAQSIEARVFSLRSDILRRILVDVPRMLREIPAMAAALGAMLSWNIRYFARLAQVWMDLVVFVLDLVLRVVHVLANTVIRLINAFLDVVDLIMHGDLLALIRPLLGPVGSLIPGRLTIDDLIEAGTDAINLALYATMKGAIAAARAAVLAGSTQVPLVGRSIIPTATRRMLLRKLGLLDQIVDALFMNTGGPMVETAPPRFHRMPNLYDLLIGVRPEDIGAEFRSFGNALADNFRGVFETVSTTLTNLAGVFDRTAAELARTGPAERLAGFGEETTALVGDLYDDQIRGLGRRIADRPPGSFERWLIDGGFHVIGAVIPQYVRSMLTWWQEEADRGEGPHVHLNPTSPHILAARAQLGRVHLPRLTLRAQGRAHDETLVRELASTFRGAVQDAYREGERRLRVLRGVVA